MRFMEDTGAGIGGVVPDAITPDDVPGGEVTGTEGQFDQEPQGGTN